MDIRVSSRGNHFGGEAPGNGCSFIYFSIQLSQILGGGGGKLAPPPPPPPDETLDISINALPSTMLSYSLRHMLLH